MGKIRNFRGFRVKLRNSRPEIPEAENWEPESSAISSLVSLMKG